MCCHEGRLTPTTFLHFNIFNVVLLVIFRVSSNFPCLGECWSGKVPAVKVNILDKIGDGTIHPYVVNIMGILSKKCVGKDFKPCSGHDKYCVGEKGMYFTYRLGTYKIPN